ncbi:VOC family protein [Solitalea longa]|uniref:VOC family protein n=1 Tax=Solitalea longa TaxID=2079460 RepID=A0A2S5A0F9_9SPHI|nr:VOC family protein [Solitalea longa]POY36078.1 VOC family protein [Solitalea longa]
MTVKPFFAPQLFIPGGVTDISFYSKAFDAVVLRSWLNDDGSIHVAELSFDGVLFHLHEERSFKAQLTPVEAKGVTALIGLFVNDVDVVINKALQAGAILLSPAQDYDYGYRQGSIQDPFGHHWLIETNI